MARHSGSTRTRLIPKHIRTRTALIVAKTVPQGTERTAAPAVTGAGRKRIRRRRAARTFPPPAIILAEDRTPTWLAVFAWGLKIRLEREPTADPGVVQRKHARRVKEAEKHVKRLKASDHERRKAGELVAHAWDALPSVNARREAVVTTGRAFLAALAAYAPDAVYPEDQHRVGRLAALAPHVATDVNGLARAPRRPEAGLRIFREDSVTPQGAFPDDATAEAVAAACGVLRVGPRPHRSA